MTANDSDQDTQTDGDGESSPATDPDAETTQATDPDAETTQATDPDAETTQATDPDTQADATTAEHPLDEADGIGERMARVREIIDQLEDGEVSLERARELHDEGTALLADVEDDLDLGDASVIERK